MFENVTARGLFVDRSVIDEGVGHAMNSWAKYSGRIVVGAL